jgi:hypothetical protein
MSRTELTLLFIQHAFIRSLPIYHGAAICGVPHYSHPSSDATLPLFEPEVGGHIYMRVDLHRYGSKYLFVRNNTH